MHSEVWRYAGMNRAKLNSALILPACELVAVTLYSQKFVLQTGACDIRQCIVQEPSIRSSQ